MSEGRSLSASVRTVTLGKPSDTIRGSRPWNSLDALRPVEPPHTCDPPEVLEVCTSCARETCTGDCKARREAAKAASKGTGVGVQKTSVWRT